MVSNIPLVNSYRLFHFQFQFPTISFPLSVLTFHLLLMRCVNSFLDSMNVDIDRRFIEIDEFVCVGGGGD